MRLLGWALIRFDWYPYKRKFWHTDTKDWCKLQKDNPNTNLWFSQTAVVETHLPSTGAPGWGSWCGVRTSHSSRGTSGAKITIPWVWGQPIPRLCPPHLSQGGFFYVFLVIAFPFSQTLGGSQWWLFCTLVVVLMRLWEKVSMAFMSSTILTRSSICI